MKNIQIFKKVVSLTVAISFLGSQTLLAGQSPVYTPQQFVEILKQVETRVEQTRTSDEMLDLIKPVLTASDVKWFKAQPDFKHLRQKVRFSVKGTELRVLVETTPRNFTPVAAIEIVDAVSGRITINGAEWQLRPFKSARENAAALQAFLQTHKLKGVDYSLNQILSIFIPEAQAMSIVLAALAVVGGLFALALVLTVGILVLVPYFANLKDGHIAKNVECSKDSKSMTVKLENGNIRCDEDASGAKKVQVVLNKSGTQEKVSEEFKVDRDWKLSPSDLARSKSLGDEKNSYQVAQLLEVLSPLSDVCKNPEQLEKLQQAVKAQEVGAPEVSRPLESGASSAK